MAAELVLPLSRATEARPLVMHVVYRFDTGGLENGVVNLLNHLPAERFRHVVVALTEVAAGFAERVRAADVGYVSLCKAPGQTARVWPAFARLVREHRPAIVHTRNLAALEMQLPAWACGVPVRIHGEHGRDVDDLHGRSRRHRLMRRLYRPFVQQHVALSRDLADYLRGPVGVPQSRVTQIINGVDTARFTPAGAPAAGCPFDARRHVVVGSVGRMQAVKDQTLLARAFVRALAIDPSLRERLRLVLVGEGPLREACRAELASAGVESLSWLPGERADVPEVLRSLSLFVLPSLAEGISNTILEAMASGLPVIATAVGGNAELVDAGRTGTLVPAADVETMAREIVRLASAP